MSERGCEGEGEEGGLRQRKDGGACTGMEFAARDSVGSRSSGHIASASSHGSRSRSAQGEPNCVSREFPDDSGHDQSGSAVLLYSALLHSLQRISCMLLQFVHAWKLTNDFAHGVDCCDPRTLSLYGI